MMGYTFRRVVLATASALLLAPVGVLAAHNCSCSVSTCSTDCNETDLRNAVSTVNACGGNRTITFNSGYGGCTIMMSQTSSTAACAGDGTNEKSVCLTGSNTVIDGMNGVLIKYAGAGKCASDPPSPPDPTNNPQPALFKLQGSTNTVKNLTMQYFPEGIYIATGSNHTVEGIKNHVICEDAVTVLNGAGTGHQIVGNNFKGNTTAPDAMRPCYRNDNTTTAPCGTDKAIQINGGGSTIDGNIIDTIGQPVNVTRGTHIVSNNTTIGAPSNCGFPNCDDVCQAYTVDKVGAAPSAHATFTGNAITNCKFGIRSVGNSSAEVNDNTICNSYVSAFQVKIDGAEVAPLMKGAGNKIKNAGFDNTSSDPRGGLVDKDAASGRVDFGGGDFSGTAVIGGTLSAGGNVFCQTSLTDINNTGAGSIGARTNCFDSLPPVVVGGSIITTGATTCSTCNTFCP